MLIELKTSSGIVIVQPEQKWMVALLMALCEREPHLYERVCQLANLEPDDAIKAILASFSKAKPEVFLQICELVDTRVYAYASIPDSVQKALRN